MRTKVCINTIIVIFFTIITSCDNSEIKNSNISNVVKNNKEEIILKPFPRESYTRSVTSSMIKLHVQVYSKGKLESWTSHCCLYCNKGDRSFLILPLHCFPYDSTKQYDVYATIGKRNVIKLSLIKLVWSNIEDAEILVVERIEGIKTLCETGIITKNPKINDSTILAVPFNVRNVRQKNGILQNNNEIKMNTFFGEAGDSGGLIISRDGVIGMAVSISENGETIQFVPIDIFEELYGDMSTEEMDPS